MKYPENKYSEKCPVCRLPCVLQPDGGGFDLDCASCGEFRVTDIAYSFLVDRERPPEGTACASWFLRRNPGFVVDSGNFKMLDQIKGPDLPQKGIDLLMALAEEYPRPGDVIKDSDLRADSGLLKLRRSGRLDDYHDKIVTEAQLRAFKWLACSASPNHKELAWLIKYYLIDSGYLVSTGAQTFGIGLEGWKLIETQRSPNQQSRDAFIAMSFNERFLPLYEQALHPGVSSAGYVPVRIDRLEHNNRIDDEIIASIRKSRFVVADFSMHRGGIYFEAGFALGFGLPVVWTVERAALDRNEVHFDNRQYNFLVWEETGFEDLARRLTNRIEATIGRPF